MGELNLCLHKGGRQILREELDKVKTPKSTSSWHPIPHEKLVAQIQGAIERSGLHVVDQVHALSPDNARYFGLLGLKNGQNPKDYALILGIRNAHDKKFPVEMAIGSRVFVCDNLAFSGEIKIARRHTSRINEDLPGLIESAVGRLGDLRRHQDARIAAYKASEMTDARAHDLVIQSLDMKVITVTRIPDVIKEWREPRHPEFAAAKNGWRLMNAFTEVMKDTSIFERPRTTQALHGLLDTAVGMVAFKQN